MLTLMTAQTPIPDTSYEVAVPDVVAESVDGELLVVNLDSGVYFRGGPAVAAVWNGLAEGASAGNFGGRSSAEVLSFIEVLLAEGLIRPRAGTATTINLVAIPDGPLVLDRHDDLADMLALDPVHDVDTQVGWPHRA